MEVDAGLPLKAAVFLALVAAKLVQDRARGRQGIWHDVQHVELSLQVLSRVEPSQQVQISTKPLKPLRVGLDRVALNTCLT